MAIRATAIVVAITVLAAVILVWTIIGGNGNRRVDSEPETPASAHGAAGNNTGASTRATDRGDVLPHQAPHENVAAEIAKVDLGVTPNGLGGTSEANGPTVEESKQQLATKLKALLTPSSATSPTTAG